MATGDWQSALTELLDNFSGYVIRRAMAEDHRELVLAALEFANTGSVVALGWVVSGMPLPNGAITSAAWRKSADEYARTYCRAEREQFRADLERVYKSRLDADLFHRIDFQSVRMALMPQIHNGQLGYHYVVESLEAILAYVTRLLIQPKGRYAQDLCRCELESCRDYFLASEKKPETGRPRTKYCRPEHMLEAHAAESTRRVRESRAGRRSGRPKHK